MFYFKRIWREKQIKHWRKFCLFNVTTIIPDMVKLNNKIQMIVKSEK